VVAVVLSEAPEDHAARGLTAEMLAAGQRRIASEHRMPMDSRPRSRMTASAPACRAVVAARRHAPDALRALMRGLRVRHFRGELLDEPSVIDAAARDAGIDPTALHAWLDEPENEEELRADMARAREPIPAARVLDHKLANWSGGRRYTCPSYEITRIEDGVTIAVPGFQPFAVYDAILANLVPGLERRTPPESAAEVLRWRTTPLSTQEVAVVCDVDFDSAREELGRIARQTYVGADGFWELADA
jgi:hypothetical protein